MVPYESRNSLSKRGITAIGCIAGGIGLFVLGSLSTVAGIVAGAVAGVVGICALTSKDPTDKTPGVITTGAGALTIVSKLPLVGFLAKPLLGLGAIILLGVGIWNGIKFFKGLKARS
jgi:hypothetical protein